MVKRNGQGMADVEVSFAEAQQTQSLSKSIDLDQHTLPHHQHLPHHHNSHHSNQQRAHLNDYKENSELCNIQRAAASSLEVTREIRWRDHQSASLCGSRQEAGHLRSFCGLHRPLQQQAAGDATDQAAQEDH
nr:GTPase-activating protein-like isoform X2 [Drosophila takahashii]